MDQDIQPHPIMLPVLSFSFCLFWQVENLRVLLGLQPSQIRIVKAVNEDTNERRRRRRRSLRNRRAVEDMVYYQIEIGNPPDQTQVHKYSLRKRPSTSCILSSWPSNYYQYTETLFVLYNYEKHVFKISLNFWKIFKKCFLSTICIVVCM